MNVLRTFIGHEEAVWYFEKLSNDGTLSGSVDETIRIWNLNTGDNV
jgi:WD40 repeat protein